MFGAFDLSVTRRSSVAVTAAVVAGLLLMGCGDEAASSAGTTGAEADLEGRTFESVQVRGHTLAAGSMVTLTFAAERISASVGCNRMTAQARWNEATLSVSAPMAMTRKACPPAQQADDEWLSNFLTSEPALRLEGSTLTLGDDASGLILREREDLPLVGTRWTVAGLVTADAVSSLPGGVTAELTIDPNGRQLNVSTGCNTGSGGVTVEESSDDSSAGTLVVEPLATTLIGCEPDAASVETHVLSVLQGRVDYVIDGRQLTLSNGSAGLVLTGAS